jgi:membrane-bound metal-dependent hydrolase YbcI (DUF457 family)
VIARQHVVQLGAGVALRVGELAALGIAYVVTALTVALLLPSVRGMTAAAVMLALIAVAASMQPRAAIVSIALTIGCSSHLRADLLTPAGIAPAWPFAKRRATCR